MPDANVWGETQGAALAKLDALAGRLHREGGVIPADRLPHMDRSAKFALAMDKVDGEPAARFRAILSRAYARADFVAGAIAQRYEMLKMIARCCLEVRKAAARQNEFRRELIDLGAQLGALIEGGQDRNRAGESSILSLAELARQDPTRLRELENRLDDLLAELPHYGRTPEHPRFFFAWRMTETACAATGIAPAYSDAIGAPENPVKEILRAALAIVRLDGERSLDETLRKFNSASIRLKREGPYFKRTGVMGDCEIVPTLGGDLHASKFAIREGFDELVETFASGPRGSFFGDLFPSEAYVLRLFGDALVGHEAPTCQPEAYRHILFEDGDWLDS